MVMLIWGSLQWYRLTGALNEPLILLKIQKAMEVTQDGLQVGS